MTKETHRLGGMLCSAVGFIVLKENNLLLPDVNQGLQWLVMYPFCYWGSTASDLDHHWQSCPSRDYASYLVNKALHIGRPIQKAIDKSNSPTLKKNAFYKLASILNAKHRSWQTHSDLTLISMIYALNRLSESSIGGLSAEGSILSLVLMGLCLGIFAHLVLDIMTPEGIHFLFLKLINKLFSLVHINLEFPEKIHLVPKHQFFATGGQDGKKYSPWESFVQKLLKILTVVAVMLMIIEFFVPSLRSLIPFVITLTN